MRTIKLFFYMFKTEIWRKRCFISCEKHNCRYCPSYNSNTGDCSFLKEIDKRQAIINKMKGIKLND